MARDRGVTIVVKQHGGETGTGAACADIMREVNDAGIKVNYDAGNVMDYLDVDPIPDLRTCVEEVRSFWIKDHRNTPRDEDCGPGFGEIDHYKLLGLVAFTGRTIPLLLREYPRPAPASSRLRRRDRRPCAHCSRVPRARDPQASEHAASLMRTRVDKKVLATHIRSG
jgi:sugar phosphate isomerase/epimerase